VPKISILIPTYNNKESFLRAFNSVLMQDYQDYEIIITDDSTTDAIEQVVKNLECPKVKYFKNQIRLGAPENWNECLRKASGEYIKILHHDDWFATKDAVEKFVKLMDKNPDSIFGFSKGVNFKIKTGQKQHRHNEKYVDMLKKDFSELIANNRIGAPSVTVFRNGTGTFFDKKLKWLVDVDFYINLLIKNNNIAFINEELVNIGIQSNRLTDKCMEDETIEEREAKYIREKYKEYFVKKNT
jgi:glycosyltransferase involved in cell wall biosynthesis